MKFSFEWLKSLTNTKFSPFKIGEILTFHFAETEVLKRGSRWVLDIDLLPDRISDASSHLGVAREIMAIEGKKFNYPQVKIKENSKKNIKDYLEVEIKTKNCLRYTSRVIFNVKVKESPKWLKERLKDCGLKPINNLVDASNYIMLLTGQPLHIFDFDKIDEKSLKKKIIIRQAKEKEKIITLENKEYDLNKEITIISSRKEPLAIAGIKGGKKAEIDKNTRNIILESANFNSYAIRKASQYLSLKTDASYRFEHNLPIELTDYAIDLLTNLILEISGGEVLKGKIEEGIKKENPTPILIEWEKINKFLGFSVEKKEALKILNNLGFSLLKNTEKYILVNPPFLRRFDFQEEIIGEISRLKGFNYLPSLPPEEKIFIPESNESWRIKMELRNWLKGLSLEEVYNYSFISKEEGSFWPLNSEKKLISLINPLSENFYYLRPTTFFNFFKNVKDNFRFYEIVRFFEIGKIYYRCDNQAKEEEIFSGVLAEKKKEKNQELFYEAKGMIETLFEKFGILREDYSFSKIQDENYQKLFEEGVEILNSRKEILGIIGWPKREIKVFYELENAEMVLWEIKIEKLMELIREEIEFAPLPLHPAVIRDISFFVKKNVLIDNILNLLQNSGVNYLEDVDLFDVYEPEGEEKSLSFHLVFRSQEKTLTSEEVEQEMEKIYNALKKIGAKIR